MSYKKENKHNANSSSVAFTDNSRNELVIVKDDHTYTTSRTVAEIFGKSHKNVLQAIDFLKNDVDAEFSRLNFQPRKYQLRGRSYPEYLISKDGFALLAMGFTGKRAMQFKVTYIKAFNHMQEVVTKRLYGDGVTLSELKRKVKWQTSWNLFGTDNTPVYLLSEVLNYLGYSSINQGAKIKYQHMFRLIEGRLWAHEEFVKMKIKQRAALNLRNQVNEACKRIELAEAEKEIAIAKLRAKNLKGGRHA
jgi:Rha family phage regulatory protein